MAPTRAKTAPPTAKNRPPKRLAESIVAPWHREWRDVTDFDVRRSSGDPAEIQLVCYSRPAGAVTRFTGRWVAPSHHSLDSYVRPSIADADCASAAYLLWENVFPFALDVLSPFANYGLTPNAGPRWPLSRSCS
jgi:hypothetical protein